MADLAAEEDLILLLLEAQEYLDKDIMAVADTQLAETDKAAEAAVQEQQVETLAVEVQELVEQVRHIQLLDHQHFTVAEVEAQENKVNRGLADLEAAVTQLEEMVEQILVAVAELV
jgi:hypothetical protein